MILPYIHGSIFYFSQKADELLCKIGNGILSEVWKLVKGSFLLNNKNYAFRFVMRFCAQCSWMMKLFRSYHITNILKSSTGSRVRASRYTALSCAYLADKRFWIGFKEIGVLHGFLQIDKNVFQIFAWKSAYLKIQRILCWFFLTFLWYTVFTFRDTHFFRNQNPHDSRPLCTYFKLIFWLTLANWMCVWVSICVGWGFIQYQLSTVL